MIAFLINELDVRGGTHKQFLKLIEYASKNNYEFKIITKKVDFNKTYPGFKNFSDRISILPVDCQKKGFIANKLNIIKTYRHLKELTSDCDIINIHDCGFETYFGAFKNHKKVVWQVNDLPTVFGLGNCAHFKQNWKTKVWKKLFVSNTKYITDFTVNVSKNKDRIKQVFNRDARVFYCGIEPVNTKRDIKNTYTRFKANKINLLSSGVFFPYRNYETQIDVVEELLRRGIDVNLSIIGSTELNRAYSAKIKDLIADRALGNRIIVHGQVDETKFISLHENSDIFLFLNIDQSWGLAVFEAMSCGIPVIVSNSVGATEILTDGVDAIFTNPTNVQEISNKIQFLMENLGEYSMLSENGIKFCDKYSWDEAYCSKMMNILHE